VTSRAATTPHPADRMWHVRVAVFGSPLDELLVLGEHGVDHLIQDVVRRLAEKRSVRMQCLSVLAVESRDVSQDLFPARSRFDERHPALPFTQKCVRNCRLDLARFARRSAR
jgi:hypothetical protein